MDFLYYFDSRLLCHFEYVAILGPFSFWVCALILNAFSVWVCSHFKCVLILNAFSFWACSHFECVLILSVFSLWMRSHFECVLILNAFSFWVCSHFECVLTLNAFSFWVCSHFESIPRPHARLTRSHSPLSKEENTMAQVSSQGYVGVLEDIRRSLTSVIWQLRSPDVSEETIDFLIHRLEQLSRHLLRIMQTVNVGTSEQILLEDVTRCISLQSNCNNCIFQPASENGLRMANDKAVGKIKDNSQNKGNSLVNFTRLILTHIKRHI